jgi:hypothetical protein
MGTFKSSRFFPIVPPDLAPVGEEVMRDFRGRGFEVKGEQGLTGSWFISIHQGGTFKAVVGMKTALNIRIEPVQGGTQVEAGIGIFGQQVIPTLISSLVFWPVLITQVAGMVQSARLDDEALQVVEAALRRYAVPAHPQPPFAAAPQFSAPAAASPADPAAATVPVGTFPGGFCSECGARLGPGAKFCSQCGTSITSPV